MIFSLLWTKSVSLRGTPVTDAVIYTMMNNDHSNHRHENPEFLTAFGWLYPQKPLPPDQTWVKAATKCTAPSSSSSSSSSSSPSSSSPSFYQLRHQCCVVWCYLLSAIRWGFVLSSSLANPPRDRRHQIAFFLPNLAFSNIVWALSRHKKIRWNAGTVHEAITIKHQIEGRSRKEIWDIKEVGTFHHRHNHDHYHRHCLVIFTVVIIIIFHYSFINSIQFKLITIQTDQRMNRNKNQEGWKSA